MVIWKELMRLGVKVMSDTIYKIIACEPDFEPVREVGENVVELLKGSISADSVEIKYHGQISFIDCGGNLESITCPCCGAELSSDWWGEAMEQAAQSEFENLETIVPCCNREMSLNELEYDFPCGFGKWEIDIWNPQGELTTEIIQELAKMSGVEVKVVKARY